MQGADVSVVPAQHTPAAKFGDQDLLCPPSSLGHALRRAPCASGTAGSPHPAESRQAVDTAFAQRLLRCRTNCSLGAKAVPSQPVPHSGRAEAAVRRDLPNREASFDKVSEIRLRDRPPSCIDTSMVRGEAMLGDPVRDGRRMAPDLPRDVADRAAAFQFSYEPVLLHTRTLVRMADGAGRRLRGRPEAALPS